MIKNLFTNTNLFFKLYQKLKKFKMNLLSFILFYLLNKYANASACDMLSDKYHVYMKKNSYNPFINY